MAGRDPHEGGRASTPLELLFDLTFVVAVGVSAEQFAEQVFADTHIWLALVAFGFCVFAVYWAWLNFSWFASAFDTDDWIFRVVTMVQMVGVCILALGVAPVFSSIGAGDHVDDKVLVLGYVVMRLAMVSQWLRVARQSPEHHDLALTYVRAIVAAQVLWVVIAFLPLHLGPIFACMLLAYAVELAGPVLAERRGGGTPWHAHHIAERYSLFAIIALGEGIVGTLAALTSVERTSGTGLDVFLVAAAGIGLTFGMWWIYFVIPSAEVLHRRRSRGFPWGYGHLVLIGAIIATGAGLHVAALSLGTRHPLAGGSAAGGDGASVLGDVGVVLSLAIPVGLYVLSVAVLSSYLLGNLDPFHLALLAGTALVLLAAVALAGAGVSVPVCLVVVMLAPVVTVVGYETVGHRRQALSLTSIGAA